MPRSLHEVLTVEEYCAVFAHERGHQILHHIWKNYARACLFIFISEKARLAQELEADDYAASAGHAKTLASAIRKLSGAQIDRNRAARLELLST